jgi:GNAT superfamily N-acetyltransferase
MDMGISRSEDAIDVSEAPPIPGLSFRKFRGESDFPIMADVMQRSRDADQYDLVETAQDIASEYRHLQNCDPAKDMLFVEIEGKTVGFTRCQWRTSADKTLVHEHSIHLIPEWRGHGLRRWMLRWDEKRLAETANQHTGNAKKVFEVRVPCAENHLKSLVEEEGYRPYYYNLLMLRPDLENIPDLPLPSGIEIRPVRPEQYRALWTAEGESLKEQGDYDEEMWTDQGLETASGWGIFQPDLWRVAWSGDEIVGAVLGWVDAEENKRYGRNWGYTQAIFVRKDWRSKGMASALIARTLLALKQRGVNQAALTVDSENPSGALRLYEKMGYRVDRRFAKYRKPLG